MGQVQLPAQVHHVLVRVDLGLVVHGQEVGTQIALVGGQDEEGEPQPKVEEQAVGGAQGLGQGGS